MSVVSRPMSLTLMKCSYYVNHTSYCALAELMLTFYIHLQEELFDRNIKGKQERGGKRLN